jgi:hypothetical protein
MHTYVFLRFWTCLKYFSAELAMCTLVFKRFQLLLCFGFLTDHIVALLSLPRYRIFMLAYSHRAFSCLISCTVLVAFLYSVSDVCIRKHSRT